VYEWDPLKAKSNQEEHGVDFADAEGVLEDVRAITIEDNDAEGEQRLVTLGMDFLGRLLVVVFTYRGDAIKNNIRQESFQKRGKRICERNMISAKGNVGPSSLQAPERRELPSA
jgi:hypothetical protein